MMDEFYVGDIDSSIVIRIGIKIVKSMDFAILISLKDLDFE
jgi:hypothetical protein